MSDFLAATKEEHRSFLKRVLEECKELEIPYRLEPIFVHRLNGVNLSQEVMARATLDIFTDQWHTIAIEHFKVSYKQGYEVAPGLWAQLKAQTDA